MRLHRKLARKVQTCQRYKLMGLDERARGEEADIVALFKKMNTSGIVASVGHETGGIYIQFWMIPMTFLLILPTYKVRTRVVHEWTLEYVPWSVKDQPAGEMEPLIAKTKVRINTFLKDN